MSSISDLNELPIIASSDAKNGSAALLERVQDRGDRGDHTQRQASRGRAPDG